MTSRKFPWLPSASGAAFTLIELLVSMMVLVIITVLVSQLVNSASRVATGSTKHLDADGQSRQVFERLTLDLAKMVRRPDADCIFAKMPLPGTSSGHDDKLFFYSEVPAFFDGTATQVPSKSPVALIGYRINPGFQLERLSKLLTWDGSSGTAPGGVMFLSSSSSPTPLNPDPLSTLSGNWPRVIGSASDSPPYSNTSDDGDYNVLAEQVFRFEVCYCLKPVAHSPKDASGNYQMLSKYSSLPIAAPEGVTNMLNATRAPAASDDSTTYQVGSRWYDATNSRAYVCTNNIKGAATWKILGSQDVAGLVVAIAVLDATTGRILPTTQVQLSNSQSVPSTLPNLSSLNKIFNDLASDAGGGDNMTPDVSDGATPNSPRLMAEAWLNTINQQDFAQKAGVPPQVASQVRIYQRYIPLNATP